MERTDAKPPLEKTGPKGSWLVIISPAGRYVGRTTQTREEVQGIHDSRNTIKLEEAFEFTSQVQVGQVPNPNDPRQAMMQVGKMNLVYRLDASLFAVPVQMSLSGALLYWLDDLKEADADAYKEMIQGALRMATGWHQERVRNTTGLEVAGAIPKGAPMPGMPRGFGG